MIYPQITTDLVFRGVDPNNDNHIYMVVVLRKMLNDLCKLRVYQSHIPNIISYINAITSKNIHMIEEETRSFEEIYLHDGLVFPIHPMELIQSIIHRGEPLVDKFRTLLYQVYEGNVGDVGCLNLLNAWLLTVDRTTYQHVSEQIYV